jgi:hypothetical protein
LRCTELLQRGDELLLLVGLGRLEHRELVLQLARGLAEGFVALLVVGELRLDRLVELFESRLATTPWAFSLRRP